MNIPSLVVSPFFIPKWSSNAKTYIHTYNIITFNYFICTTNHARCSTTYLQVEFTHSFISIEHSVKWCNLKNLHLRHFNHFSNLIQIYFYNYCTFFIADNERKLLFCFYANMSNGIDAECFWLSGNLDKILLISW